MSDAFKKVVQGQKLAIPAEAYNAFIDTAQAFKKKRPVSGAQAKTEIGYGPQAGVILVKNMTGESQPQFSILGIDTPIIPPGTNLQEFKQQPAMKVVEPSLPDHKGRYVILLEPLGYEQIGRAVVSGVVLCKLDDQVTESTWAECVDGETDHLESASSGSAKILWRDDTPGTDGFVWCCVEIHESASSATTEFATCTFYEPLTLTQTEQRIPLEDGFQTPNIIFDGTDKFTLGADAPSGVYEIFFCLTVEDTAGGIPASDTIIQSLDISGWHGDPLACYWTNLILIVDQLNTNFTEINKKFDKLGDPAWIFGSIHAGGTTVQANSGFVTCPASGYTGNETGLACHAFVELESGDEVYCTALINSNYVAPTAGVTPTAEVSWARLSMDYIGPSPS